MNRFFRSELRPLRVLPGSVRIAAGVPPLGRAPRPPSRRIAERRLARAERRSFAAPLLLSDIAAFLAAGFGTWLLARGVHAAAGGAVLDYWHGAVRFAWPAVLFAAVLGSFHMQGRYGRTLPVTAGLGRQWSQLASTVMVALFAGDVASVVLSGEALALPALLPWFAFVPLAMAGRLATLGVLTRRARPTRTVLIGDADVAAVVAEALEAQQHFGHEVIETIDAGRFVALAQRDGGRAALHAMRAGFAVVALGGCDPAAERMAVQLLDRDRAAYAVAPDARALPVTGTVAHAFFGHDVMLLQPGDNVAQPLAQLVKPAFDFAIAAALLLFLTPVVLVLALLVRRDGGPALFSHLRIGVDGRPFGCFKFRSMVVDAEQRLAALLESDSAAAAEWAATRKLKTDPRITKVGQFMRRTSLDELPQLLNVLRGEMSLVGPRPVVASEMPRYAEDAAYYCKARPGLTGLWQVSGRSDTSYERRVRLDVWYVRNWSFWHDLAILVKTVPAVLLRRGSV